MESARAIRWVWPLVLAWVACSSDTVPAQPEFCLFQTPCPDGEVCDGTVCRQSCSTSDDCRGDLECQNGMCVRKCTSDADCRTSAYCDRSVCTPLWGEACQGGDQRCLHESFVGYCHPSGAGWTVNFCPQDTICLGTACVVIICQAGEQRCVGEGAWEVCNDTGTAFVAGDSCETGWACHQGNCRLCPPGQTRCLDAGNLEVCSTEGDSWVAEACPDLTVCEDNRCKSLVCEPGSTICISQSAWDVCSASGTGFDPGDDCGADEICYLGACRTPCEFARLERSSIGCTYYAVDTNPIHQVIDIGIGGDFAVALSNVDPVRQAHVLIERKEAGTWSTVPGGDLDVDPLDLQTVILPHRYIDSSAIFEGGAYRITSDLPLIAYQFNPIDGTKSMLSDASLLLPASSLDTHYLVAAWPQAPADTGDEGEPLGHPAHIQIVASASTQVSITPSISTEAGPVIGSLSAGQPHTFDLTEGDFLQLSVLNHMDSFSGTIVESEQPVGVFSSNDCANVPADYVNCCCEHLEEQLFGLQSWGKVYMAARAPRRGEEPCIWQILASEAGTTVSFDAHADVTGLPGPATLGSGEILEVLVNGSAEQPGDFLVSADKPILVVQYTVGAFMVVEEGDDGDPSMVQAVPVEQFLSRYVVLVPYEWENDYFILTRPSGVEIRTGGTALVASWVSVGTSGYEVARVSVVDGVHVLEADQPFGVVVIGWDEYDSYAYPGGLNLQEINPM